MKYFHVGEKATDADHQISLDLDQSRLLLDANGNEKGRVTVLAEFRSEALSDAEDIIVA